MQEADLAILARNSWEEQNQQRRWKPLAASAPANIWHSSAPSWTHINPHTKGMFISGTMTPYNISGLKEKKLQGVLKGKKKFKLKEQSSHQRQTGYATAWGPVWEEPLHFYEFYLQEL